MLRALFVVTLLCTATAARAQIQKDGPEVFPSKHELSAHLGYQAGFGGQLGTPSGVKLQAEYAYRFHELVWFDLQLAHLFGAGGADGPCANSPPAFIAYCYRGGWALELAGGVKLKFKTRIPLVVEVPLLLGLEGIYNRDCGDNGAAFPVVRVGGGVKYFLKPKIGVGASVNFAFGPAYHTAGSHVCQANPGSYTDFYGAFDFLLGAEFIL